jgi:thioesterase domain-containing protein
MAACYIDAMRTVQPQGPYHIAGWSFGGFVAYEMARQLHAQGESVPLVAVIEAVVTQNGRTTIRERLRNVTSLSTFGLTHLVSSLKIIRDSLYLTVSTERAAGDSGAKGLRSYVKAFWTNIAWGSLLKQADMGNVVSKESRLLLIRQPSTRDFLSVSAANMRAFRRYELKPYDGRVTVFRAAEQPRTGPYREPSHGWAPFVSGGVEDHEIPGDHFSIIRTPNVLTMASRMRACMDATSQ